MPSRLVSTLVVLALAASPALAEDQIPGHHADGGVDGLLTGSALLLSLGLMTIPVNTERGLWSRELGGDLDDRVRGNFSRRAGLFADATVALSVAAPIAYLTGTAIDDADGDRLLLYGESLAINLAINTAAKYIVQRPRPYLYSRDPAAVRHAAAKRGDARLSFYSSHAATSFCAAVSGAYLFGASTENGALRSLVWSLGLGTAAATSNLRVRAGEHFYSDVIIGAVVGIAVGYAVPALHADDRPTPPSGEEVALAAVGVLGGLLASQLIPLEQRPHEVVGDRSWFDRIRLAAMPMVTPTGVAAGIAIAGAL